MTKIFGTVGSLVIQASSAKGSRKFTLRSKARRGKEPEMPWMLPRVLCRFPQDPLLIHCFDGERRVLQFVIPAEAGIRCLCLRRNATGRRSFGNQVGPAPSAIRYLCRGS